MNKHELSSLVGELETCNKHLRDAVCDYAQSDGELRQEINSLKQACLEYDQIRGRHLSELEHLENRVDDLNDKGYEKDARIRDLEVVVGQKSAEIRGLISWRGTHAARIGASLDAEKTIREKDAQIAELETTVDEHLGFIHEKDAQIRGLEAAMARVRDKLKHLEVTAACDEMIVSTRAFVEGQNMLDQLERRAAAARRAAQTRKIVKSIREACDEPEPGVQFEV